MKGPEVHVGQPHRQGRVEIEHSVGGVGVQTEQGAQQVEGTACGPCLGHVRAAVLDREAARLALDAGIKLRKAVA
jgi:hypothetical protein